MLPKDLSPESFLADYWQKKPLLIKNALPDFQDLISPEELAGLACEEDVESRLVFKEKETWRLQNGPFTEEKFTSLSNDNWTLLVQAVDQWLPAVKKLLSAIAFIPDWRLDDVMVSYASNNAGIGPHFDYYDVIIIQGQGQRHWQLGQSCNESSSLRQDSDLKILQDFRASDEFTLECGDALYIPPGIAHQGTSLDKSLSYSIGFRAPSYAEIISQYAASICAEQSEDQRYTDPELKLQDSTAEISEESLQRLQLLLTETLQDKQKIKQWFGQHMTSRKYPELTYFPEPELQLENFIKTLNNGLALEKHPAARFAFYRNEDSISLFADGEVFEINTTDSASKTLIAELCDKNTHIINSQSYLTKQDCIRLLCRLYNRGTLLEHEETD